MKLTYYNLSATSIHGPHPSHLDIRADTRVALPRVSDVIVVEKKLSHDICIYVK
jgi:hypothetical protein